MRQVKLSHAVSNGSDIEKSRAFILFSLPSQQSDHQRAFKDPPVLSQIPGILTILQQRYAFCLVLKNFGIMSRKFRTSKVARCLGFGKNARSYGNRMAQLTVSRPEEQLQQPLRRQIVELRRLEGTVKQYAERASALLPDVDNESGALFKWIHASACLQHTGLVPNKYQHAVVALHLRSVESWQKLRLTRDAPCFLKQIISLLDHFDHRCRRRKDCDEQTISVLESEIRRWVEHLIAPFQARDQLREFLDTVRSPRDIERNEVELDLDYVTSIADWMFERCKNFHAVHGNLKRLIKM